jgi:8-oxo-dGTP diphosphatase
MPLSPGPALCVDLVVPRPTSSGAPGIVLVARRFPPLGWALPGGFVDLGESCEAAAVRELQEETGLVGRLCYQLHTYSAPSRDARRHTASVVFVAEAEGEPVAGDDAGEVAIWPLDALPELAFDHATIVADYRSGRFRPAHARD